MHLYKYVNAARIDVFKTGRIGFPEPMALNDPFETLPYFDSIAEEADFRTVFRAFESLAKRKKQLVIKQIHRQFQVLNPGLPPLREFRRQLSQLWPEMVEEALGNEKELMESFSAMLKLEIGSRIGVLSLTEDCNNLLMWAHYGQNHEGFIIEFDSGHKFFDQAVKKSEEFRYLGKVRYAKQRPGQSSFAELSPIDLFFIKSEEWRYENEWRFLRSSSCAQKTVAKSQGNIYLFSVPPTCITGVILGCRMATEARRRLCNVVLKDKRYRHINITVAKLDRRGFKLNYFQIESPVVEPIGP